MKRNKSFLLCAAAAVMCILRFQAATAAAEIGEALLDAIDVPPKLRIEYMTEDCPGSDVRLWEKLNYSDKKHLIRDALNDIESRSRYYSAADGMEEISVHEMFVASHAGEDAVAELREKFFDVGNIIVLTNISTRINDAVRSCINRSDYGFPVPSLETVILRQTQEEYHYQLSHLSLEV